MSFEWSASNKMPSRITDMASTQQIGAAALLILQEPRPEESNNVGGRIHEPLEVLKNIFFIRFNKQYQLAVLLRSLLHINK